MRLGKRLRLFLGFDGVKIHAGILLDRVDHGETLKGLSEVDLRTLIGDRRAAADDLGEMAEHTLRQLHHAVIIGVRLIQLHEREFRIVTGIQTFVTEHTADLVHPLQTADNEPLEIQLQRNAQLHILVQRIVVRFKRTRRGAARVRHEHGGLDLHKAAAVEEAADLAQDLRALDKRVAHLGVDDQIEIPLAVAHIGILQSVEFFRQRLERLGKQRERLCMDGDLAGFRAEHETLDTDNVADVHFLEIGIHFFPEIIAGNIALDDALFILNLAEGRLAHDAFDHHASGNGHLFADQLVTGGKNLRAVMGHVVAGDHKRILARVLQVCQLLAADAEQFAERQLGSAGPCFLCHSNLLTIYSISVLDGKHFVMNDAGGRFKLHPVALLLPDQSAAERRLIGNAAQHRVCFLAADDLIGLLVLLADLADGNAASHGNGAAGRHVFQNDGVFDQVFDLGDFGIQLALLGFCFVIFAVLRQIAEGTGFLDLLGNLLLADRLEVFKLLFQLFQTLLAHSVTAFNGHNKKLPFDECSQIPHRESPCGNCPAIIRNPECRVKTDFGTFFVDFRRFSEKRF